MAIPYKIVIYGQLVLFLRHEEIYKFKSLKNNFYTTSIIW